VKRSILYIRCSDGRSRRPAEIRGHCVHQIRLPGGVLNADFKSQLTRTSIGLQELRKLTISDIRTMIDLKNPDEIILASHQNCGAADALGLCHEEVMVRYYEWKTLLGQEFPGIPISVIHEHLPIEDESERLHVYVVPAAGAAQPV
jgi:hypothetical protein